MVKWLLKLIVGSRNNRVIRGIAPLVVKINEIEKELQNGPEETLREKTAAWKEHPERYTLNVATSSNGGRKSSNPFPPNSGKPPALLR
jgi:preprotein translocase subunit SecA